MSQREDAIVWSLRAIIWTFFWTKYKLISRADTFAVAVETSLPLWMRGEAVDYFIAKGYHVAAARAMATFIARSVTDQSVAYICWLANVAWSAVS